jgi:ribosome-associated protein
LIFSSAGAILGVRRANLIDEEDFELTQSRTTGAEPKTTGAEPKPDAGLDPAQLTAQARATLAALEDSKAEEIVVIDLAGKTSIADVMIVASGRSTTQVGAAADRVIKALKEAGAPTPNVEGVPACDWVLIDAGDLIIHLFRPEVRQFYNLEKMWGVDRPGEKRAGV